MTASARTPRSPVRLALRLALPALLVACWSLPVRAQPEATPRRTVLTLDPIGSHPTGRGIEVSATLRNLEGEPQDNKVVEVYLDDAYLRRARTGPDGRVRVRLPADLSLGVHEVRADFIGTEAYRASSARDEVTVRLARLTVETIPPLPGVAIRIDGTEATTGPDGVLVYETDRLGTVELEVLHPEELPVDATTRAEFERWSDSRFTPARTIEMRGDATLQAGFDLYHPVRVAFRDARDGGGVPWERVSSLVLKGANGSRHTLERDEARWLLAGRVQRARTGLYFSPLLYSVESVTIDGTNVVNRYQQRFYAEPGAVWPVELLLYSAVFRARDAVLGFGLGSGLELEYPDGRTETHAFDADGEVRLEQLARGLYRVRVLGVKGMAPPTPVALSRDQDVSLKVLSWIDIVAGTTLGVLIAFGLLLYGRPTLFGLRPRGGAPVAGPAGSD